MAREKGGFWVGMCAVLFYPFTWLVSRWRIEGLDKVPATGPVLVVANHISYLDPVFSAVFVHRARRVPRFLAKASIWKVPVAGWTMAGSGQIPVYRGSADAKDSLRAANAALAAGKLVVIYPEGTITKEPDGWPMYARTGVARLALDNDVPVLPVARWGTKAILDGYHRTFRPFPRHDVVTVVGEPVDLSKYRGREVGQKDMREVTDLLMGEITSLVAQVRGETPPVAVFKLPPTKPKRDKR